MNEASCDIHDVTKAAADLVALGCTVGATHFHDGIAQLKFGSVVSSYANEVIKAVNEGVISAWQGLQEIRAEFSELSSKASFYVQNGIGVVAGAIQVETGIAVSVGTGGAGAVPGGFLIAHGVNNIYEGVGNIYNGPDASSTVGPIRRGYQALLRDDYKGNMLYYSGDLGLSGWGAMRLVRKPDSVQLFRHDPINHERAYQQAGKLALYFEGLVDAITINSMRSEEIPN